LDGKHVVFGRVINGHDLVTEIENQATKAQDKPVVDVTISECGELAEGEDDGVPLPEDGDLLPNYPEHARVDFSDKVEVISVAENIRTLGNNLFGAQDFEKAAEKYSKAIRYLYFYSGSEDELYQITPTILCRLNRAACYLKLGKNDLAIQDCDDVLEIEPTNEKAHFRKIEAIIQKKDYDAALKLCKDTLVVLPENVQIQKQQVKAKKLKDAERKREQKAYAKMF